MMTAHPALIAAVVALLASLYIHVQNDFGPLDIYAPRQVVNASVEELFSDTYYHARALFRKQAQQAGATLFKRPLEGFEHLDVSIDFAVLDGAKDRVVLHISGTHGVEGFAGSAIQSALLKRVAKKAGKGKDGNRRPTVIFVHALNAYGFSQLRRFNEHNVDINRNWLTPENFTALAAADPNAYGYMDVFDVLNPSSMSNSAVDSYWAKVAYYLSTKGFVAIKRALVSGNYRFPKSIFYGGNELQPSLRILREFLEEHVELDKVRAFGMIDVHTGLGKPGADTLMVESTSDIKQVERVFSEFERTQNKIVPLRESGGNKVSEGYDGSFGLIMDGVATLLPPESKQNNVLVLQEFGTVPGAFILKAVAEENFIFHAAPSQRLPYAEKLRDVFYLHRSFAWKRDVLDRGLSIFDQISTHVATSAKVESHFAETYDGVAGLLCSGMSWFLPTHVQSVCLTQEFGTAPGLVVMKALIEENAMFHYAPSRRLPYAQKLRDAFYLHRSYQWKSDLIERGLRVFGQLQTHVASVA